MIPTGIASGKLRILIYVLSTAIAVDFLEKLVNSENHALNNAYLCMQVIFHVLIMRKNRYSVFCACAIY